MSNKKKYTGPIEELSWKKKLQARVVSPGEDIRIHGYSVGEDLAPHYSFCETMLLTLTGDLPKKETGQLFEMALKFSAPITVGEAPSHAALLAKLCGSEAKGSVSVGTVALLEQIHAILEEHSSLIEGLTNNDDKVIARFRTDNSIELKQTERIVKALDLNGILPDGFDERLSPTAAILSLFHHCGLRKTWQIATAWVLARLPCVAAEANMWDVGGFANYPMNTPEFIYEEE